MGEVKDQSREELDAIKRALFIVAAHAGEGSVLLGSKKLQEEYYLVTSDLIVKEFFINDQDTVLMDEMIKAYQRSYN